MALITCKLCRKIFTAAGGRTCPECKKRLDDLYMRVRDFLRDNPKLEMHLDTLSESLNVDIREIQALVDMGYLDRDTKDTSSDEVSSRQKLALEFEKSLEEMRAAAAAQSSLGSKASITYGQQLYSEKSRRR